MKYPGALLSSLRDRTGDSERAREPWASQVWRSPRTQAIVLMRLEKRTTGKKRWLNMHACIVRLKLRIKSIESRGPSVKEWCMRGQRWVMTWSEVRRANTAQQRFSIEDWLGKGKRWDEQQFWSVKPGMLKTHANAKKRQYSRTYPCELQRWLSFQNNNHTSCAAHPSEKWIQISSVHGKWVNDSHFF